MDTLTSTDQVQQREPGQNSIIYYGVRNMTHL